MIDLKQYNYKEWMLFITAFLVVSILVLRDQLITPFILLYFFASIPFLNGIKPKVARPIAWVMIVFYALHVITLAYSENWDYGGKDLMTKLSYVAFPLFVIFVQRKYDIIMKAIRWGLILSCAVSMFYALGRAFLVEWSFTGDAYNPNVYGLNMHPSYLSLIYIITTLFLWREKMNWKGATIVKILYSAVVIVSLYYMRSLGAFACIATIMIIFPIWMAIKHKNWKWYLVLPIYAIIFVAGISGSAKIANDVDTSIDRLSTWSGSPEQFLLDNKNDMESNTVRLVTWTLSSRVVAANPLGVGIGDVKDELETAYRSYGYTNYARHQLNPHNQFLQTGIAVGWLGIVLLVLIFIILLIFTWKINDIVLFIAIACIAVSCLFESMLERQVGVILLGVLTMYTAFKMHNLATNKQSTEE